MANEKVSEKEFAHAEFEHALNIVLKFTGRQEFGKLPGLIAKALILAAGRDLARVRDESITVGELESAIEMTSNLVDELDCVFQNQQMLALNRTCDAAREYLAPLRGGQSAPTKPLKYAECEGCHKNRSLELYERTGTKSGWLCEGCIKDIEEQAAAESLSERNQR